MSFQVALDSRNVLVPLGLEDRQGERMHQALSRLDTATALVVRVSAAGGFAQEFIPLRIRHEAGPGYDGREWELWVQKAAGDLHAYYLGVPDTLFSAVPDADPPRSLSVQVVGTSPLTGREDFTGGVDVILQAHVDPPLIPGFLALAERFFPTLLPHNFIAERAVAEFAFGGKRDLILMAGLQRDPADGVPVSLGKHWEAKNWMQAVIENLAPPEAGGAHAWYSIQGGCFYGRNRRVSHWFGRGIGLEDKGFRQAAGERIRELGPSANGAWVFWLEPHGDAGAHLANLRDPAAASRRPIAIRHPMLHGVLSAPARAAASARGELAGGMPISAAVSALAGVAQVLASHQDTLQRAMAEPAHAMWSARANPSAAAALALEGATESLPPGPAAQERLAADISALYRAHGETLRALEAHFDAPFGYSAWDAVGHSLREALAGSLAEAQARAPA
jgi:hypothetical protein